MGKTVLSLILIVDRYISEKLCILQLIQVGFEGVSNHSFYMRRQHLACCYDPWDGSHSFIGNQAAGQARGHHGSQVTNQQGVT